MRLLAALACFVLCPPAYAITGNAPPASGAPARPIVMVTDARGDLCTGTALALDLVLTAAHCMTGKLVYTVKTFQGGAAVAVRGVAIHPQFKAVSYAAGRATADIALLKLAAPLTELVMPATLAPARRVAVGETLTIAGFGVTAAGTARGLGVPRMTNLSVTGKPGSLQIRLVDPATRNLRSGLGACTGDSGAPVFDGNSAQGTVQSNEQVIGVVSWSTAPSDEQGCGGLTGVTPLLLYRAWIQEAARKFHSTLAP
jgi:secreted trypsin-like serine protease